MNDINEKPNYLEISTIVFDHKLNNAEILALKDILFTEGNKVSGLYFRDTIDYNSIEIIKYLTEMSPYVDDKKIEKFILLNNVDYETIMNMNFENIDTWKVSYNSFDNRYKLTSVSDYRNMESKLRLIVDDIPVLYSDLEKVAYLYNKSKLLDYNELYDDLPMITKDNKASSLGYNSYFKRLLDLINIKSTITFDNDNYVTLVDIKDDKYDIDGIYLFDPMRDTISKEKYQVKELRSINFNYFGLKVRDYTESVGSKTHSLISCLSHDLEYDLEKYNLLDNFSKERAFIDLKNDFKTIHDRVEKTKTIKDEVMFSLMEKVIDTKKIGDTGIDISYLLKDNYLSRKGNKNIKIKKQME